MASEEKVAYMNTSEKNGNKEAVSAYSHLLHIWSSRVLYRLEVGPGTARAVVSSFETV